tara:strand:- start:2628 stop:4385 length:1758 start_codon:yes stop_codon:yes gene_type:complete
MNRIEFLYFNNVFLDNGIIGLYQFLQDENNLEENIDYGLEEKKLWIQNDNLFELLETLYYALGRKVYDTYTMKQEEEGGNLFFKLNEVQEIIGVQQFPKMNTYGFTALLTNNAQGTTIKEENTKKFAGIEKENPSVAKRIQEEFTNRKIKLLSKIYFNERYTKITRLEKPVKAYFVEGNQVCYLTGQKRKKLVDSQNISPFFSGISNFNSFLINTDKKVCWEAMYLSRFSAATCLYQYPNKLREAINVYFVFSNNLLNLNKILLSEFGQLLKDPFSLKVQEYISNFPQRENEIYLGKATDFIGLNETLFFLTHCIYKEILKSKPEINKSKYRKPLIEEPVGLISIRAESFASTMRPKRFENITHFSFIIELIYELEKSGLNWRNVIQSLKLLKPSLQSSQKKYELERQFRERIISRILKVKSILPLMETFFNDCYGYLLDSLNEPSRGIGFKRYKDLLEFVTKYELYINPKIMNDKELQDKSIKLGAQIGQGILGYGETPVRKTNARQGRKYIIALRKANQFDRFLHELARIQARFVLNFSREFLENIDEERFQWVRQFVIISALNQINAELSPKSKQEPKPTEQ